MLMVTTLLHWDRFNHDYVLFWAWVAPLLLDPVPPALAVGDEPADRPGRAGPGDAAAPRPLRLLVGAVGAAALAFAAVMFVRPSVVVDAWPWRLTTATARSISAFLAFPAVTWLWFLFDQRWSSFRITQQTAGLGMFLIGVGALRARDEFAGDGELAFYVGRWPWASRSSSSCRWSWTAGRRAPAGSAVDGAHVL